MRAADLARLSEPYPEAMEPTEADARAAIGIKLPHWDSLESEIFADFTEQQPYGIGWWAPDPGTSRRILIADHLSCCLASVAGNMTEASLSLARISRRVGPRQRPSRQCRENASQRPVHRPAAPEMPFRTARPRFCPNASGRFDPRNCLRSRLSRRRHHRRRRPAAKHSQG